MLFKCLEYAQSVGLNRLKRVFISFSKNTLFHLIKIFNECFINNCLKATFSKRQKKKIII